MIASAGLVAGAALTPAEWSAAQSAVPERPRDVGRKFYPDGRVMPFAGNTIICHLPQQGEDSEPFRALLDIYRELPLQPFARKMTPLPPSSYHMTVIGGANDKERRRSLWPRDLPLDASMASCNAFLGGRLQAFRLGDDGGPYRMAVDMREPSATETPLTLRLVPADDDTREKLYRLRARLSSTMGIGIGTPDHYGFHITLGYAIEALTQAEDAEFRSTLRHWKTSLSQRVPIITLGAPEYCVLDDMFYFARQFYLT